MTAPTVNVELETDGRFQTTEWRVQRIGWILWAILIAAAAVGLLGPGWLSGREAASSDGALKVRYERFLHYDAPSQLVLLCDATKLKGDLISIRIGRSLLDQLEIVRIDPAPAGQTASSRAVAYDFRRDLRCNEVKIVFHVTYDHVGGVAGDISLANSPAVTIRQFVYP